MSNMPTVMNPQDLSTALANSQVNETAEGGSAFLKMEHTTGDWVAGQDADEVSGDELIINTPSIQHGWILWSGGRPNKVMVPFTQVLPQPMPPIGSDSPSEGRSLQGAFVDDGSPVVFDTNSYGGRKAVDKLLAAIKAHAATGSKDLYPKVKLASESYANKKHGGTTYNPVFEVVAWCDGEGVAGAAPAAQVEDQSAGTEEAEAVVEQPKRQRRQRKATA